MDGDVISAVKRNPLLAPLPTADVSRLVMGAPLRAFSAGEVLYHPGDPARYMLLLVSGQVELFVDCAVRGPCILDLLTGGDTLGEEAVLEQGEYTAGARGRQPGVAVVIERAAFLACLEAHFDLVLGMLGAMAARLRGLVQEITELKLKSTSERLAGFLVSLTTATQGKVNVRLPCDKHLLAEKLGMQPESLSRAFARLREHGVRSERNDRVTIGDVAGLRRYCQADTHM